MTKRMSIRVFLSIEIMIIVLLFLANSVFTNIPIVVFFSFLINVGVFSGIIINSISKHKFSFGFIHSFFMLFMLTLAPMIQLGTTGTFLSYKASSLKIVFVNFIILIWTVVFYWGRNSIKELPSARNSHNTGNYVQIPMYIEYLMTFLMIVLAVNRIRTSGFSFFRNSSAQTNFTGTGLSVLLFAIRISIVMVSVSLSIYRYKYSKKITIFLIINLILCLIIAFPTAIPRFLAATIYGGIILMLFDGLKKNYLYPIGLLAGFVIVFPMLSSFRYENDNIDLLGLLRHVVLNVKNEYNTGNYDGYMMLSRTIDYVDDNHVTFGYSLLGNILFFIPRSVWPSKPVGSGAFIAEYSNLSFTNTSESLIAESYLNFGIIGLFIYAYLFGKITKKLDVLYWNNSNSTFVQLSYTFYVHIFLILLRGDFMTGFLYISVLTIVFLMFYKVFGLNKIECPVTNKENRKVSNNIDKI